MLEIVAPCIPHKEILILSAHPPKGKENMDINNLALTQGENQHWLVDLKDVDLEKKTLGDVKIYCEKRVKNPTTQEFEWVPVLYSVTIENGFGYKAPMIKEVADKAGNIGVIALRIREKPGDGLFIVVENDTSLDVDGKPVTEIRATRGSVDNPDRPDKGNYFGTPYVMKGHARLNNKRIFGGPVRNMVIEEPWDAPIETEKGQHLVSLEEYVECSDGPGLQDLARWLVWRVLPYIPKQISIFST